MSGMAPAQRDGGVGKSNVRIAIPGKACYLQLAKLAKHLIGERHSHTLSALQRRAVVQQVPGHESDLQQLRLAVYTLGRCHSRPAARRERWSAHVPELKRRARPKKFSQASVNTEPGPTPYK